jgi:hypothetical protein
MPDRVVYIRQDICQRNNCQHLDRLNFRDPCEACPAGHWGRYSVSGCDGSGLGDIAHSVAQPIARVIDKATAILFPKYRTNLSNCLGCQKRRRLFNERFPLQSTKT